MINALRTANSARMPSPKNAAQPSAVIFDVGNVLYGWDPESFLSRQIPDDAARLRFIQEVDLFSWHETLDAGRPFPEAAAELSGAFPEYAHLIEAWGQRFGEMVKDAIPGVHSIVRELHDRWVPLFAITNFSADLWNPFHERERALFALFSDIVVSGEVKLLKPDPAIFEFSLQRFGLKPWSALFVDDRLINVEAAASMGMHAHLFTNAENLRAELSSAGLL